VPTKLSNKTAYTMTLDPRLMARILGLSPKAQDIGRDLKAQD